MNKETTVLILLACQQCAFVGSYDEWLDHEYESQHEQYGRVAVEMEST